MPRAKSPSAPSTVGGQRPAHRPSRRQQIIPAAIDEFAKVGVAAATIANVARRAGMTAAAVYYHFPSREDLIAEVVRDIGAQIRTSTQPQAGDEGLHTVGLFDRVFDEYERWEVKHGAEARIFWVETVGLSPLVEAARRETLTAILNGTEALLAAAGLWEEGPAATVNALALVTLVLAAMEVQFRADGKAPSARQLRAAVSYVGGRVLRP